jgi:hypothetical protein
MPLGVIWLRNSASSLPKQRRPVRSPQPHHVRPAKIVADQNVPAPKGNHPATSVAAWVSTWVPNLMRWKKRN